MKAVRCSEKVSLRRKEWQEGVAMGICSGVRWESSCHPGPTGERCYFGDMENTDETGE